MARNIERYIFHGNKKVKGWLSRIAMDVILELSLIQNQLGIAGPVCEIGVHHGKLFILLHLITNNDEISVAWDLFENQIENIDNSGRGDKEVFIKNLDYHKCDLSRIKIFSENSLRLPYERIIAECGDYVRMFSIDGGHTAENTENDLLLAEHSICDGGIIILDDYFNESWPGVAEGTSKYFINNGLPLIPIAIVGNKILLTNKKNIAEYYMKGIDRKHKRYTIKKSWFWGHEVLIFISTPLTKTPLQIITQTKVWNYIREKPLGMKLRKSARKFFR